MKSINTKYKNCDILRSHRVGNSVRKDRQGRPLPPRQIIVRLKDPTVKKRILKSSKDLKESKDYSDVLINVDLHS